jgi:hypothetical protein
MRTGLIVLGTGALFLTGCEKVWSMLPHRGTNVVEVKQALAGCRIRPSELYWRVEPDGTFAYMIGENRAQMNCLRQWTGRQRIRTANIIT